MVGAGGGGDWSLADRRGEFPIWMPNDRIALRLIGGQTGVGVINNDGNAPQMLINDGSARAIDVAPDGSALVYMSQEDGNWELYRYDFADGARTRLTENPAHDGLPAWSPDGAQIAFLSRRDGYWALWLMNPDGTGQQELIALPAGPDGYVPNEPDYSSRGWLEESIDWGR